MKGYLRFKKYDDFLSVFFAGFLPIAFTAYWVYLNTQLPVSDPANYLSTAVNIYHHFVHSGFWKGMHALYADRGWRPIFFPVVIVPFLIFLKGNLIASCASVSLLSIIVSVIYLYRLFRLELDQFSSILATNLIGLLPFIQVQILGFYAESLLFPCILGGIYHLILSNNFRDKLHSVMFVFFLSLAFIIRPVELVLHYILLLSYVFYAGYKGKNWNLSDLSYILGFAFFSLTLFFGYCFFHYPKAISAISADQYLAMKILINKALIVSVFLAVMFILFGWINRIRLKNDRAESVDRSTYLLPVFLGSFLIVILWFYPFSLETFQWIYSTSLGDVATGTTRSAPGTRWFWDEFWFQLSSEGAWVVLSIAFVAMISIFISFIEKTNDYLVRSKVFIYVFLLTPLPFLEVFFTVQDINRKLSIAFPALIMCLLLISLKGRSFLKTRTVLIAVVVVSQFILLWNAIFIYPTFNEFFSKTVGYYIQRPILDFPNRHNVVVDFLTKEAKNLNLKSIGLAVNPYTMEPVDPFLTSMMIEAIDQNYNAGYAYFPKWSQDTLLTYPMSVDAVLVSDVSDRMLISSEASRDYYKKFEREKNPSVKAMYQLLYHYADQKLEKIGWQVGPCITIHHACLIEPVQKAMRVADCRACLFLPIKIAHK